MKRTFRHAVKRAIREADAPRREKFRLRFLMAVNADARQVVHEEIEDHLDEIGFVAPAAGLDAVEGFDIDTFERLLKLIIEYLPQILALILPLFALDSD